MVENIHKKINIILTDDWKLPGNGHDNVYEKFFILSRYENLQGVFANYFFNFKV